MYYLTNTNNYRYFFLWKELDDQVGVFQVNSAGKAGRATKFPNQIWKARLGQNFVKPSVEKKLDISHLARGVHHHLWTLPVGSIFTLRIEA